MRVVRGGGIEQFKNTMRAGLKNNRTLDVGANGRCTTVTADETNAGNPRPEAGNPRESGIETETVAGGRSGWQLDEKNCLVWTLFTPCTRTGSLLEPIEVADENAVPCDVILRSPARSSCNRFRIYQVSDVFLSSAVSGLATATGSGVAGDDPNRQVVETG